MELLRTSPTTAVRAGARIWGRVLVGVLAAAGLVLGFGSAASAGGWAVTTLDAVPTPVPGEALEVGFTIRQHGVTPVDLDEDVAIEITAADGTVQVFPATHDATGHYIASVTFPAAGDYTWTVHQGWFGEQELGALSIDVPAATATDHRFPVGVRYGLIAMAAVFASLAIADGLSHLRRRRTVMA
ncbi:MAG: hypothetical protein AB7Q42_10400 [Acidimicrobiia bacterium]